MGRGRWMTHGWASCLPSHSPSAPWTGAFSGHSPSHGEFTAGPSGRWVHVRCLPAPTRRYSTLQLRHRSTSPLHASLHNPGSVCTGAMNQRGRISRLVRGNPRINQSTCWACRLRCFPAGSPGSRTTLEVGLMALKPISTRCATAHKCAAAHLMLLGLSVSGRTRKTQSQGAIQPGVA